MEFERERSSLLSGMPLVVAVRAPNGDGGLVRERALPGAVAVTSVMDVAVECCGRGGACKVEAFAAYEASSREPLSADCCGASTVELLISNHVGQKAYILGYCKCMFGAQPGSLAKVVDMLGQCSMRVC